MNNYTIVRVIEDCFDKNRFSLFGNYDSFERALLALKNICSEMTKQGCFWNNKECLYIHRMEFNNEIPYNNEIYTTSSGSWGRVVPKSRIIASGKCVWKDDLLSSDEIEIKIFFDNLQTTLKSAENDVRPSALEIPSGSVRHAVVHAPNGYGLRPLPLVRKGLQPRHRRRC